MKKVGDIENMVQQLLDDQRELKSKISKQEAIIQELSSAHDTETGGAKPSRKSTVQNARRAKSTRQQKKVVQSADPNKGPAARRIKEQNDVQTAKLEAIESRLEKARKRRETEREQKQQAKKTQSSNRYQRAGSEYNNKGRKH